MIFIINKINCNNALALLFKTIKTKSSIHRGNMNVALCSLYYRVNIYEKKILLTLCTYFSISLCQYDGRLKK